MNVASVPGMDASSRDRSISDIEKRTIRRIFWRLLPFLSLCYFVAQLDRVNVSFAALTMNQSLGFTATLYGWGAGIFFLSYVLFEVPSNLIMERVGARLWIARIMVTWGLLSMAMALVQGAWSFLALRFLLGMAEAGFFPGVLLYLVYWFPQSYRARVVAIFTLATPVSTAAGAILSAPLLAMDGLHGLAGWQWMFALEGVPAIVLGVVTFFFLTDRPEQAKWLGDEERAWLVQQLADEERSAAQHGHPEFLKSLREPRVLVLTLVWFCRVTCLYGVSFFLPQVVKTFGGSDTTTALVSAVPFAIGSIGMLAFAYNSDRTKERRWHLFVTFVLMSGGLFGAGLMGASNWTILPLTLATIGYSAMVPCFWPLPAQFLTGAAAAGGIAFINAVGNLGGFIGPYAVGWAKDQTQSFAGGLYLLGAVGLLGAIIVPFMRLTNSRPEAA